MAKQIIDKEFGEINVSLRQGARAITIKLGTDGRLQATAPKYTPLIAITAMINARRTSIRSLFEKSIHPTAYADGSQVGKSHRIVVVPNAPVKTTAIRVHGQNMFVRLAPGDLVSNTTTQRRIRDAVIGVLRTQAKAYLPRRLKELATRGGYHYERVRFSHAGTRWGSCSSTGTISLNIALMKLPDELIDYVIMHELAHTRHMNHSTAFWDEVGRQDPHYKVHRRYMKAQTPSI